MTTTNENADQKTPCPVCFGDGYIFEDEPCPVCHGLGFVRRGDMETEAEIRTRIAKEVRADMDDAIVRDDYTMGWRRGMARALRIIERGTGVAAEGEHDG